MVSAREELHTLIDQMSDSEASELLLRVRGIVQPAQISLAEWLEEARTLAQEMAEKYGNRELPNSIDILNEIREERLDDLMGGQ